MNGHMKCDFVTFKGSSCCGADYGRNNDRAESVDRKIAEYNFQRK